MDIKNDRKNIFSTVEMSGDRAFTDAFMSAKKNEAMNM